MAKIMLVEDDNNLREIYGARLPAEGHEIVAAQDGEEALALAVKEKPDLIISDVMMPHISGFDMLDILRNAPETKETKVIMMTALSQAEDKARADKLGADRYLVKSQVTLEDVANVVREVLDNGNTAEAPPADEPAPMAASPAPAPVPTPAPAPTPVIAAPAPAPVAASVPAPEQPAVVPPTPVVEQAAAPAPIEPVVELDPAPTIPEITSIPEQPTAPAGPATVEQIAHPEVEMPDDSEVVPVQAPPAPADEPAPMAASPAPAPVPTPAPAPTPVAATPAPAPVATDLPPVVQPAEPIKVVMPTPLDGTKEQDNAQQAAPDQPTATPVADDQTQTSDPQTTVGPSLLETLQAEENENPQLKSEPAQPAQPAPLPPASESDSPQPIIANGTAVPPIVTPNRTQATQLSEEPQADEVKPAPTPHEGGMKKVIQPLSSDLSGPDINALLAVEEQKAAVENPVANTVIKPLPPTPAPTPTPVAATPAPAAPTQPVQPAPPKNDDVNNIAL